jgi:uncharacterized protein YbgA (DUF1722 family)/uncharacterized protein YbbK (DUF523 family)
MIPNRFLSALRDHARISVVCPEVEIGLGVPRDPIQIVQDGEVRRLIQPSTGLDLTAKMLDFREDYLAGLGEVDGFVLKSRSPSCGITDAKVHAPKKNAPTLGRGPGLFAAAVLDRFPSAAVEDEGRLTNYRIREHFLTRLFAGARLREMRGRRSMGALVSFHAQHKFLLMATHQTEMRALGRIVANPERRPAAEVIRDYCERFPRAFARIPKYTSQINVLMHALGHFKEGLTAREKAHFLDTLQSYREERLPLSSVVSILRSWIVRFEEPYLADQVYFRPFPEDLIEVTDSGKGRGR